MLESDTWGVVGVGEGVREGRGGRDTRWSMWRFETRKRRGGGETERPGDEVYGICFSDV